MLDPELMGHPQKVEEKDPLEDKILQKFLKQESEESEEAKEVENFGFLKLYLNSLMIKKDVYHNSLHS